MPFPSIPRPIWPKTHSRQNSGQTMPKQMEELMAENDSFGLPAVNDPDPFGVLALEQMGMEIKEAGTGSRPSLDTFEYRPSPTSPIFSNFARRSTQSIDGISRRNSRRDSKRSMMSVDQGTQTMEPGPPTINEMPREDDQEEETDKQKELGDEVSDRKVMDDNDSDEFKEIDLIEERPWSVMIDEGVEAHFQEEPEVVIATTSPTVHVFSQAGTPSPIVSRARLVTIPKKLPPKLPPRNPHRNGLPSVVSSELTKETFPEEEIAHESSSVESSPTQSGFDNHSINSANPWSEQMSVGSSAYSRTDSDAGSHRNQYTPEQKDIMEVMESAGETKTAGAKGLIEEKDSIKKDVFHSIPTTPIEPLPGHSTPHETAGETFS